MSLPLTPVFSKLLNELQCVFHSYCLGYKFRSGNTGFGPETDRDSYDGRETSKPLSYFSLNK